MASPTFSPDPEGLCKHCLTLAQILNNHHFSASEESGLVGLFELMNYFADELRTPRFVRTALTM